MKELLQHFEEQTRYYRPQEPETDWNNYDPDVEAMKDRMVAREHDHMQKNFSRKNFEGTRLFSLGTRPKLYKKEVRINEVPAIPMSIPGRFQKGLSINDNFQEMLKREDRYLKPEADHGFDQVVTPDMYNNPEIYGNGMEQINGDIHSRRRHRHDLDFMLHGRHVEYNPSRLKKLGEYDSSLFNTRMNRQRPNGSIAEYNKLIPNQISDNYVKNSDLKELTAYREGEIIPNQRKGKYLPFIASVNHRNQRKGGVFEGDSSVINGTPAMPMSNKKMHNFYTQLEMDQYRMEQELDLGKSFEKEKAAYYDAQIQDQNTAYGVGGGTLVDEFDFTQMNTPKSRIPYETFIRNKN